MPVLPLLVMVPALLQQPSPSASAPESAAPSGPVRTIPARDSQFLRKQDVSLGAATMGATAAIAMFDERIARWMRQPSVQGDSVRHDRVSAATVINEMPLTVAAITVYGVGRLIKRPTIADVGWHLTEALLATEAFAETMRIGLGRARPRASPDDAFVFRPGRGFSQFEYRAFPSLHASVAFTTAAVLSEEMRVRKVEARRWAIPLLYAAAAIPGFTRLYLDQHWASDVLAGTVVGAFLGSRVVRYTHARPTKLDRWALVQ